MVNCTCTLIKISEFNASDVRNKKSLIQKLKTQSQSVSMGGKRVVLMDEVDGMTSDRGGLPELVSIIKKTRIPIICICNDRQNLKIQTLANHCEDIKFRKLDSRSILSRLKIIMKNEGFLLPDNVLNEIILSSHCDMRYALNSLQKNKNLKDVRKLKLSQKDQNKNIFELVAETFKNVPIAKKMENYFEDYSMVPLFIQENYPKPSGGNFYGKGGTYPTFEYLAKSSDSISFGDTIDTHIHGAQQNYSLLPYHCVTSTIYPTHPTKMSKIDFPLYLGRLSKTNKNYRILHELSRVYNGNISASNLRKYALPILMTKFMSLLEKEDISEILSTLFLGTNFTKDDFITMTEILGEANLYKKVPTKVKSLLTREYKKFIKEHPILQRNKIDSKAVDDED